MATVLKDQQQRTEALNIHRSFIVQAPAGSGKTELLVQRYLALLSQCTQPEQVLVLTFTRKAAAEMRHRVLETLKFVASDEPPSHAFQPKRWQLGKQLLSWQTQQAWNLLEHPERLKIQTIDAFYAELARKAPWYSGLTANTQFLEDPTPLYRVAIQQLLFDLEKDAALERAMSHLMQHVNNDMMQVENLLVHMLSHREQWVGLIPTHESATQALKKLLEQCLRKLCTTVYEKAKKTLTQSNISYEALQPLLKAFYKGDKSSTTVLPPSEFWSFAADLFLTKQGTWRRIVPSAAIKDYPKELQKELKSSLKQWLETLSSNEAIRWVLLEVRQLPPVTYQTSQWSLLSKLFYILNVLVNRLNNLFRQRNQVDYTAVALKAEQMLGLGEEPSDFLLHLDYRLQHILVDEFQDTSLQQLRFLNRLTEGWQPKDGRTLFLVGDPMQSIYRFRKAEARLFKLVRENGLGSCELASLELSTNFRSNAQLVAWVSSCFQAIEGRSCTQHGQGNLLRPSVAFQDFTKNTESGSAVQTHWLTDATPLEEANQVVQIIQSYLNNKKDNASEPMLSIAVLGRARQHLLPILNQLRLEGISHQAIEIETLADKPVIKDLLALTRALTHLGDDIAWLALLRAPWCGLYLSDLHQIMQACQRQKPSRLIWDQLHDVDTLLLSNDSKARLKRFMEAIQPAVETEGRLPLRKRILTTWHRLGGACTQAAHTFSREDVDSFLRCVDELQVGETLADSEALENKLKTVYATAINAKENTSVTLMTIHKAKGLEFDVVIVPSLHKTTRSQSHSLILFDEMPTLDSSFDLLLAPIKSSDTAEPDAIYRYLRHMDMQHYQAEAIRLLYVACTRAKQKLHLVGCIAMQDQENISLSKDTFLYWLWPHLNDEQQIAIKYSSVSAHDAKERKLKRMLFD